MFEEIILGTAQFGLDYGISNKKGKIVKQETIDILESASLLGIKTLDTSQLYGDAEKLIGEINPISSKFKVNTKIQFDIKEFNSEYPLQSMDIKLNKSLNNIRNSNLNALMVHNGENFVGESKGLIEWAKNNKKKGRFKYFGISIYHDKLLTENIIKHLDFIQIPFSIINQEAEKNGIVKICKKYNVDIHVRSIFSQGLIFIDNSFLPKWIDNNDKKIFQHVQRLLRLESYSIIQFCCSFIRRKEWIKSVTIGVTSVSELQSLLGFLNEKIEYKNERIEKLCLGFSDKIKDPRRWE